MRNIKHLFFQACIFERHKPGNGSRHRELYKQAGGGGGGGGGLPSPFYLYPLTGSPFEGLVVSTCRKVLGKPKNSVAMFYKRGIESGETVRTLKFPKRLSGNLNSERLACKHNSCMLNLIEVSTPSLLLIWRSRTRNQGTFATLLKH